MNILNEKTEAPTVSSRGQTTVMLCSTITIAMGRTDTASASGKPQLPY